LYMLRHRIPAPSMADPHADDHWKWVYTVWSLLLSLVISTFITYAIERPLLKKGWRAVTDLFARRAPLRGSSAAAAASDG
jgi:peptidoglycan/LPS O-acetylase OafA/YrhL